jgi:hypothetical protein
MGPIPSVLDHHQTYEINHAFPDFCRYRFRLIQQFGLCCILFVVHTLRRALHSTWYPDNHHQQRHSLRNELPSRHRRLCDRRTQSEHHSRLTRSHLPTHQRRRQAHLQHHSHQMGGSQLQPHRTTIMAIRQQHCWIRRLHLQPSLYRWQTFWL